MQVVSPQSPFPESLIPLLPTVDWTSPQIACHSKKVETRSLFWLFRKLSAAAAPAVQPPKSSSSKNNEMSEWIVDTRQIVFLQLMTVGSGDIVRRAQPCHHRPISNPPPSCMIWQLFDWWSSHIHNFGLCTGMCVYKGNDCCWCEYVCSALMCILGGHWHGSPVPQRLHDNERSVNIGQLSIWVQHSPVLISKPQSPISPPNPPQHLCSSFSVDFICCLIYTISQICFTNCKDKIFLATFDGYSCHP